MCKSVHVQGDMVVKQSLEISPSAEKVGTDLAVHVSTVVSLLQGDGECAKILGKTRR